MAIPAHVCNEMGYGGHRFFGDSVPAPAHRKTFTSPKWGALANEPIERLYVPSIQEVLALLSLESFLSDCSCEATPLCPHVKRRRQL